MGRSVPETLAALPSARRIGGRGARPDAMAGRSSCRGHCRCPARRVAPARHRAVWELRRCRGRAAGRADRPRRGVAAGATPETDRVPAQHAGEQGHRQITQARRGSRRRCRQASRPGALLRSGDDQPLVETTARLPLGQRGALACPYYPDLPDREAANSCTATPRVPASRGPRPKTFLGGRDDEDRGTPQTAS